MTTQGLGTDEQMDRVFQYTHQWGYQNHALSKPCHDIAVK